MMSFKMRSVLNAPDTRLTTLQMQSEDSRTTRSSLGDDPDDDVMTQEEFSERDRLLMGQVRSHRDSTRSTKSWFVSWVEKVPEFCEQCTQVQIQVQLAQQGAVFL